MAELEHEEIIIIEEDPDTSKDADISGDTHAQERGIDLKKIVLIIATVLIIILLALIAYLLVGQQDNDEGFNTNFNEITTKLDAEKPDVVAISRLEKMIAKANTLYSNGDKENALVLYEKIAHYSEAISQYNLGVAQLKEQRYGDALKNFNKAIQSGERECASAINAAVCSLHLNNTDAFDYYIELAYASLAKESNSALYSYYYTLINYYKKNYQETLIALRHPTSSAYQYTQDKLHTKINTLFGNYYDALNTLENTLHEKDYFTLALLYANIGDLTLSKKYLLDAIAINKNPMKEQLALAFIYLKSGLIEDGGTLLRDTTDTYDEAVYTPYPVHVHLKKALFDTELAQEHYRNHVINSRRTLYETLFYFSPYRVFNAEQTISYIRKGNANIYIDDISSAKEYLHYSKQLSQVNKGIAEAIQKSLSFHLRSANKQLRELLKIEPKHSILNYNLALTYAQLGDHDNAYKYFLKSYHLDANNYLSGIYALLSGQLLHKESQKLHAILKENLANEDDTEEFELYRTLLHIATQNYVGTLPWIEHRHKDRPLYLALEYIIASKFNKQDVMRQATQKLSHQLPYDIVPHLLYIHAHNKELSKKAYAAAALSYLKQQKLLFDDLYYGPFLTRYLYAQMALITGMLHPLHTQLQQTLQATNDNPQDIINALAIIALYAQKFEESYSLYNQLIDDYKQRDAQTLFLGAVSAIASEHKANAIALLELAKLKNPNDMESRYALGLLYLEIKNNHGAAIQFQRIGNNGFHSEYFNFGIQTKERLFQKRAQSASKH